MNRFGKVTSGTLVLAALVFGTVWATQQAGVYLPPSAAQYGAPYAVYSATASTQYAAAIEQARGVALELAGRGIPGLSVAVAVGGEIVWSEGFGYADLEQRVPVGPSTRFRIGSVSKPLTAAAMALLYEQGRLDLDAPVRKYVPSFPEKAHVITTRHLAGHLAGIRHYRGDEFLLAKRYNTVLEGLTIFQDDPLVHPPGTKFGYSSYGWNLISAVIEGAAGQEFLGYMNERIFRPLGMRETVADQNEKIIGHRARFYSRGSDKRLRNGPYVDNSHKWAGGGFLSTAEDLVRFGSAHLRGAFLKPATLEMLFTTQRTASGEETGYGLGWGVGKDSKGRRLVQHGGGSVGGTSMLMLYPESKVVVAVLSNLTNAPYRRPDVEKMAEAFLK